MKLYAAVARRRIGTLQDDAAGRELRRQAGAWMAAQHIKNPVCTTRRLAPGFPDVTEARRCLRLASKPWRPGLREGFWQRTGRYVVTTLSVGGVPEKRCIHMRTCSLIAVAPVVASMLPPPAQAELHTGIALKAWASHHRNFLALVPAFFFEQCGGTDQVSIR
jgi:hypothetical protein